MFNEFEEYFSTLKIDKSPNTLRSYTNALNRFIEYFSIKCVDDIKKLSDSDIQSYLNFLASKPSAKNKDTAKSSANAHYRVIKAFLNWLKEHDYIEDVPIAKVRRYKEAKRVAEILTKEERDNIILATKKRLGLHAMMVVMFYTGIRRSEAINIKIEDINNGYLLIHGKGNKERQLPLTPFVQSVIKEYLSKRKDGSPYLFVSLHGQHQITDSSLQARVKKACEMGGIEEERLKKIGAHTIRRSFACNLLLDGWSTFAIQKALGHSSVLTTDLYVEPAKSIAATKALMNQSAPSWYEI